MKLESSPVFFLNNRLSRNRLSLIKTIFQIKQNSKIDINRHRKIFRISRNVISVGREDTVTKPYSGGRQFSELLI